MVLHGAVGSPQIEPCLAGRRFWADIAPAKKLSAVALVLKAIAVTRSMLECIEVPLQLIMVRLFILWGGVAYTNIPEKSQPIFPICDSPRLPKIWGENENVMAERVGFEPTERFPAHSISSAANSTTLAPLPRNCRLSICDCRSKNSLTARYQSAMFWRRGWDSNPRWALTHSGFRDRCTNPLCDLSVIKV